MSALRSLPLQLPPRQLFVGPPPSLVSPGEEKARQWGQIALAMLVGALFVLFAASLFDDIQSSTGGESVEELFSDTRF